MSKRTLVLLAFLLLTGAAAAQIRVDVQLVNVVATVTDNRGRYVPDLKISDFVLMEDGSPQQVSHFTYSNDLPVSVGIVLDTSGSMERKIGTATRAVDRFLRDIHEDDDIFLMTFDDVVRVRQDFTSDRTKLRRALDEIGPASLGNGTSLYDAVIAGVEKLRKGKHPKKAILLISDGVDTTSSRNFNTARIAVREAEMLLYGLGIAPDGISQSNPGRIPGTTIPGTFPPSTVPGIPGQRPPTTIPFPIPGAGGTSPFPGPGRRQFPGPTTSAGNDTFDMGVLNSLADASGGSAWMVSVSNAASRTNTLQNALDQIADELRNQYSLGYYPSHDLKDGKWHRIELETKNTNYRVRYKEDYLGK